MNWFTGNNGGDAGEGGGAPDTGSIWAKMAGNALGINHIVDAIRNPQMIAQAMAMMQAMIESQMANARIEAKLDIVLRERGVDVDAINRSVAERFGHNGPVIDGAVIAGAGSGPVIPEQLGPARTGAHPAAGRATHNGSETAARSHRRTNGGR